MDAAELIELTRDIQLNCDISDAADHGIYTMCTMVLKLRNLYKWEKGLSPWEEPASTDLLAWIEKKEEYWETLIGTAWRSLAIEGKSFDPFNLEEINRVLSARQVYYGAGFGRSMKHIFFLSEILEKRAVENCQVLVLGKDLAKEMACPFAMLQDGLIIIRKEPLRYFVWDLIAEPLGGCRSPIRTVLQHYGVIRNGKVDHTLLANALDTMVADEMNIFIYHEIGEKKQNILSSKMLKKIVSRFPGTVVELVIRSIKDMLADLHPKGLLAYVIREQRVSSLGLYISLLDGMRQRLFPEIMPAWERFLDDNDWSKIADASEKCNTYIEKLAKHILAMVAEVDTVSDEIFLKNFNEEIMTPLGLAAAE